MGVITRTRTKTKQDLTEYCINLDTGNVKLWNPEMVGRAHIVKCTKNGIPIPRAANYQTGPARLNRVEEETEEVEEAEGIDDMNEDETDDRIELSSDNNLINFIESESDKSDISEPSDVSLTVDTLMDMYTKSELIERAKTDGVEFTNTEKVRKNKEWFAKEIIKKYEIK